MNVSPPPEKPLRFLRLPHIFGAKRTKKILSVNPTIIPHREEANAVSLFVFDYDADAVEEKKLFSVGDCFPYKTSGRNTWINIDGLRKADVEAICAHYNVHPLVIEDILSINQRPKMEETEGGNLFCLLNMLYYNEDTHEVEQEQISILLGKDFVISFQEDSHRDVFNPLRDKLKTINSKIRQRNVDYLCYTLLDLIVDHYFVVMEKIGEDIEEVEDEVSHGNNPRSLSHITHLRRELIVLKRNFSPVRELVNGFMRCESPLLDERTNKYFKDIYDHIVHALDLSENYRDIIVGVQDLHINNVNLRMNEVMKVMAIVTCLLAPATVIGGVFGMNFTNIPYLHDNFGFWVALAIMLVIPIIMIWLFRRRGWF